MIFTSDQKLTFGKYHGIQVGMVYMLAPSYINWMLTDTDHCIENLDFLTSLKTLNRFSKLGHVAHHTEVDIEEFKEFWTSKVTFEEIMYSGFKGDLLSDHAIERNRQKLRDHKIYENEGAEVEKNWDIENTEILLYYPNLGVNSYRTIFTPLGMRKSKKGITIVSFEANNRRRFVETIPHREKVNVSSFYIEEWGIEEEELERRIENKLPFFGQIKDGYLMLEKNEVDLRKWYKEQH